MTSTCLDGASSMKEMQTFKFGEMIKLVKMDYATLFCQIELASNQIFLHIAGFDPKNWSREIYLDMLDVLNETEKFIKKRFGVEQLFVMIDGTDKKLERFEMLFGFFPFYTVQTETGPMLIMFKEI